MQLAIDAGQEREQYRERKHRLSRINRREFLTISLTAGAAYASPVDSIRLSLLPLYSSKYEPVDKELIEGVTAALNKTYLIKVDLCPPELFDASEDANAFLDYISRQPGHVMAIMTGPLRAPVRTGLWRTVMNVLGWADILSDDCEHPRGSVITTYGLENLRKREETEKFGVVAIHELGHNLGAWDCTNGACYMNGRIELGRSINPRAFCSKHEELLWRYLRGSAGLG